MIQHIMVPLDGSPLAECVLRHVLTVAKVFGAARVTLLRVVERSRQGGLDFALAPLRWHLQMAEAKQYLDQVAAHLTHLHLRVSAVLVEGKAAEGIAEYIAQSDVGLLILSTHGHSGLGPWSISGVVQKVILGTRVPTLLVRAHKPPAPRNRPALYRTILAPVDGSRRAECVLPMLNSLATTLGARVVLAHVIPHVALPHRASKTQQQLDLEHRLVEMSRDEGERYVHHLATHMSSYVETRVIVSDDVAGSLHGLTQDQHADVVVLCAHGCTRAARWPYGTTPLLIVHDVDSSMEITSPAAEAIIQSKGH
ncbi:MAG: universal stress protein [Chloroflexi bacterium]|nr:universal stress protein [Chloroflexota bacterium]